MASGVVDLFMLYQFLKKLVTPFNKTKAFELGIIDERGNVLKKRKDLNTIEERQAFGLFDVLVNNIKKLIEKVPGGKSRIASYAAALLLLREGTDIPEDEIDNLFKMYLEEVTAKLDNVDALFESLMDEDAPTMSAGSGAIAGIGIGPQGEPGLTKKQMRKYKMKNAMVYMMSPDNFNNYKNKTYEDFQADLNSIGEYPTFIQDEVSGALHYLGRP